jgi:hypothetical protein
MDGAHGIELCFDVTCRTLKTVFDALYRARIELDGMVLKPNMVIAGKKAKQQATTAEIAALTLECFRRHVPSAVPGIVFLSGGQSEPGRPPTSRRSTRSASIRGAQPPTAARCSSRPSTPGAARRNKEAAQRAASTAAS